MADLGRFNIANHILSIKIINEENIIRIKTKVSVGNSNPQPIQFILVVPSVLEKNSDKSQIRIINIINLKILKTIYSTALISLFKCISVLIINSLIDLFQLSGSVFNNFKHLFRLPFFNSISALVIIARGVEFSEYCLSLKKPAR